DAVTGTAIGEKVEGLVVPIIEARDIDWTAVGNIKHVVIYERWFLTVKKRPGISYRVGISPVHAAMQGVLAGLGHHLDLGNLSVFCRRIRRDDLCFPERFDRGIDTVGGPSAVALVIDGRAVGREVNAPAARAVDDDITTTNHVHTGGNVQDVDISPAVLAERQFDEISRRLDLRKR